INSSHAATFGGNNPQVATEVGDDTGAIWLRAPVSVGAGNIVLIAAANAPGIIDSGGIIVAGGVLQPGSTGIAQDAGGALIGTGILTAVALRGAGGPNLGGAPIALNFASPTMNSIADVNLFACAYNGCPRPQVGSGILLADWAPFKTAPFLRNIAPIPTGKYGDGPIDYSSNTGTNISGIGTVNDLTFLLSGAATNTLTALPLSGRKLTIE